MPKDPSPLKRGFLELKKKWDEKLKESGFHDLEDDYGNLKSPDRRTISWENRERLHDFFRCLDHYLTDHPDLPPLDRQILELYSSGIYQKAICERMKLSRYKIKDVIDRYKRILTDSDSLFPTEV